MEQSIGCSGVFGGSACLWVFASRQVALGGGGGLPASSMAGLPARSRRAYPPPLDIRVLKTSSLPMIPTSSPPSTTGRVWRFLSTIRLAISSMLVSG